MPSVSTKPPLWAALPCPSLRQRQRSGSSWLHLLVEKVDLERPLLRRQRDPVLDVLFAGQPRRDRCRVFERSQFVPRCFALLCIGTPERAPCLATAVLPRHSRPTGTAQPCSATAVCRAPRAARTAAADHSYCQYSTVLYGPIQYSTVLSSTLDHSVLSVLTAYRRASNGCAAARAHRSGPGRTRAAAATRSTRRRPTAAAGRSAI